MGLTARGIRVCLDKIRRDTKWITLIHKEGNGSFYEVPKYRTSVSSDVFDIVPRNDTLVMDSVSLTNKKIITFVEDQVDMSVLGPCLRRGVLYVAASAYKIKKSFLFLGLAEGIQKEDHSDDGVVAHLGKHDLNLSFGLSDPAKEYSLGGMK